MGFKLKQKYEVFKVVDGPFAGHTYRHGLTYDEVPSHEQYKFDELVEESKSQKVAKSKKENPSTLRPLDSATNEDEGGKT